MIFPLGPIFNRISVFWGPGGVGKGSGGPYGSFWINFHAKRSCLHQFHVIFNKINIFLPKPISLMRLKPIRETKEQKNAIVHCYQKDAHRDFMQNAPVVASRALTGSPFLQKMWFHEIVILQIVLAGLAGHGRDWISRAQGVIIAGRDWFSK